MGGIIGVGASILRQTAFVDFPPLPPPVAHGRSFYSFHLLRANFTPILHIAASTSFSHITYLVPFVLLNSFVPLITSVSLEKMMALNTALLIFDFALIPFMGKILTRFSVQFLLLTASGFLILTIIPLFCSLKGASLFFITGFRVWVVFWGIVFMTPLNIWYKRVCQTAETPTYNQYLITGMGSALGTATIGRLSPVICLWLWHVTHSLYAPASYLALMMALTPLSIICFLKNERKLHDFSVTP